ncbi:MAG: hypothetical protein HDR12_00345 [Lachnospiraceae bacterium]|nr:hypothetical protein [Lachnospiraceae bacterium]
MEQKEFLKRINECRRRLNLAGFLNKAVFALCVGAGAGILFQAVALITPLYYANLYTGLALLLAVIAAVAAACVKRIGMKQAALAMDGFGFGERIITAYEHLGEDGVLIKLQREDAMRKLDANKEKIRIPLLPSWKKNVVFLGLSAILIGLALTPSVAKDRAIELHKIREEARDKAEEIEDAVEELKQLMQEDLAPEQQASIQEMIESLESSISEFQQASSTEAMSAAGDKLNYKYNDVSSQLSELAKSLENGAEVSAVTAQSMQAMAKKMQEMSGMESSGGNSLAYNNQGSGDGQGGESGQGGENNQNGGDSQNGNNGQDDGAGQNGQGSGDGQGSEDDQSGGDGSGGENGQGSNGQGSGSSDGGSGSGRGTGGSDTPHDYVSVPNDIADSENLTGSSVDHDASEFFRAPNGLSWEGEHISHEAVIGSYEQNAYEGIAAGKYPSGMEDVIKEYFSSFN